MTDIAEHYHHIICYFHEGFTTAETAYNFTFQTLKCHKKSL